MGNINEIQCRNKDCRYHATIRTGPGVRLVSTMRRLETDILNGKEDNQEALKCLESGSNLHCGAGYLCSHCKELVQNDTIYCYELFKDDSGKLLNIELHFPFGKPICDKCGNELIYLPNVRSSKVKCPKCGGELKSRIAGYFD